MYRFLKNELGAFSGKSGGARDLLKVSTQHHGLSNVRRVYNEFSGKCGVEATRYGDWEYAGRCTDF